MHREREREREIEGHRCVRSSRLIYRTTCCSGSKASNWRSCVFIIKPDSCPKICRSSSRKDGEQPLNIDALHKAESRRAQYGSHGPCLWAFHLTKVQSINLPTWFPSTWFLPAWFLPTWFLPTTARV